MTAVGHWVWVHDCETCEARFANDWEADEHMEEKNHYRYDYPCETCNLMFRFEDDRDDHQQEEGHHKHLHCEDCDRYFQSPDNLNQHLSSRTHQGTTVECPFCDYYFTTASGLAHHIESSACPESTYDRLSLCRDVRKRDPGRQITEHLWGRDPEGITEQDLAATWNGDGYECSACDCVFDRAHSLLQHLGSALAHRRELYHCPKKRCAKKFPSLAALFNHLESETCGFARFDNVQKNASGFLGGKHGRIWHEPPDNESD